MRVDVPSAGTVPHLTGERADQAVPRVTSPRDRRALARSLDGEAEILVVGEAASAVDALARAPAARPHLVLTGAHLRDPDTPELCRRLHGAMPGVHIIVVGVNASRELVAELISSGAAGVVPHTIDDKELMDAIRTAAAGRVVLSTGCVPGPAAKAGAGW